MGAPPSAATAELRRQLRRVRWGRNLVAAQIALFGTIATLAAVAAVLILLALLVTPASFAAGLVVSALVLVTAVVLIGRHARRTWVRRRDAAPWVDAAAGLDGRLTTLLALDDRAGFLLPLLRAQNDERRARWTPERLIPAPFPPVALAAAVAAGLAMLVVLLAVPSLRPPLPQLVAGGGGTGTTPIGGLEDLVERLLVTGIESGPESGQPSSDTDGAAGSGGGDTVDTLAHLPAALQTSIRRSLWGERFATAPASGRQDAGRASDRHASRTRTATPGDAAGGRDTPTDVRPLDDADAATPPAGTGDAASGAGTGSDPNLLGTEIDDATADGHFALGLAARVLGRRAGLERPAGTAPPRDGDQRPALAARQRPADPFHATSVPSAYTPIVRSLFARGPSGGGTP